MLIAPMVRADDEEGPRGKYRKSAATRSRILDAALQVFGEAGFENGSLREIAEKANISQAGLLHHYPSKVAVLSAVMERRDEQASKLTAGLTSGLEKLAAFVEYARASADVPYEINLFTVLSAEATRSDHPANAYMQRRYHWVGENMQDAWSDAGRAGHLHSWVTPRQAASQLIAIWDGLQIQWLLNVSDINVANRLEHFINLHLLRPLAELISEAEQDKVHNNAPHHTSGD